MEIPDFNEKDLMQLTKVICDSYEIIMEEEYVNKLISVYLLYKKQFISQNNINFQKLRNFHRIRDYINLIKSICLEFLKINYIENADKYLMENIISNSFNKNFGDLDEKLNLYQNIILIKNMIIKNINGIFI